MNKEHDLIKAVKKAAGSVAFQWPGVIEIDDLVQELHVWILESPSVSSRLDSQDATGKHKLLVRQAHRIASNRNRKNQVFNLSIGYSVNDVKQALAGEAMYSGILTDLTTGLDFLRERNERYADAVKSRYGDGVIPEVKGGGSMVLSRALTALTDEMNRALRLRGEDMGTEEGTSLGDGPGTRQQVSRHNPYT